MSETEVAPEISNPLKAEDTTTLSHAASQLLKEPEQSAPPEEEPEDVAEPTDEPEEVEAVETLEVEESEELEEEGEPEEVGEQQEEVEELAYYAVKVDGEDVEVTLEELQSGYQRQKDYTKKTQAVAEQRKAYDAQAAELQEMRDSYTQQASLAQELLNRDLKKFESVDWEKMKVEDPVGYLQKQIEVQDVRRAQAELQQQSQAAYEHNLKGEQQRASQHLELQRKEVLKSFPEWSKSDKAQEHQGKLVEYGLAQGYTQDQLNSVTDAVDLVTLDKAMKYDALQTTKKGITKKAVAPAVRKRVKVKGVAPKGVNRQKQVDDRKVALRKSGSLKDAAALMAEMRTSNVIKKARG
jgi:hypothetical protein